MNEGDIADFDEALDECVLSETRFSLQLWSPIFCTALHLNSYARSLGDPGMNAHAEM